MPNKMLKNIFKNYGKIIKFQTIFFLMNLFFILHISKNVIMLTLFSILLLSFAAAAIIFYYKLEIKRKIKVSLSDYFIVLGFLFINVLFTMVLFLLGCLTIKTNLSDLYFETLLSIIILASVVSILFLSYLPAYYLKYKNIIKSFKKVLKASNLKISIQYANFSLLLIFIPTILFLKAILTWSEFIPLLYLFYITIMSYLLVPLNYKIYWKIFLGEKK